MPLPPKNEWQFTDEQGQIMPWFTEPALRRLWQPGGKGLLPTNAAVLEWGCGHSTVWWARYCTKVHSVDHDAKWATDVREAVDQRGYHNVKLELLATDSSEAHGRLGEPYVLSPLNAYGINSFDVVVVDGWCRLACAVMAIQLVKKGGLIIVDNAERDYLRPVGEFYGGHGREQYRQPGHAEWRTDIWIIK